LFSSFRDLGKGLDADEAIVMGAVFRAANISTAFQVRRLGLLDIHSFPVGIRLHDLQTEAMSLLTDETPNTNDGGESQEHEAEQQTAPSGSFTKRVALFKRYNALAKKKTVTLSHSKDLVVTVHHDSPKLLPEGTTPGIVLYNVTGIHSLVNDPVNRPLLVNQTPRVNLVFHLDSSGLASLTKAEATLEETIQVPIKKKKNVTVEAQTINATSETPSSETPSSETPSSETPSSESDSTQTQTAEKSETENENENPTSSTSEQTTNSDKQTENQGNNNPTDSDSTSSSSTSSSSTGDANTENEKGATDTNGLPDLKPPTGVKEEVEYVSRVVPRQFNLQISSGGYPGTISSYDRNDLFKSKQLLSKLRKQDLKKRELAKAKNDLESFIYETRAKMYEADFESVSTEEQRQALSDALMEAEEWMSNTDETTTTRAFRDKLTSVQALSNPINFRVYELTSRPQAINATQYLANYTRDMLMRFAIDRPWIPEEDRQELLKMVIDVEEWLSKKEEEQEKLLPSDMPAFASEDLFRKLDPIARYSQQLLRRKKPPPPKIKKENVTDTNETETEFTADNSTVESGQESQTESNFNEPPLQPEVDNEQTTPAPETSQPQSPASTSPKSESNKKTSENKKSETDSTKKSDKETSKKSPPPSTSKKK